MDYYSFETTSLFDRMSTERMTYSIIDLLLGKVNKMIKKIQGIFFVGSCLGFLGVAAYTIVMDLTDKHSLI